MFKVVMVGQEQLTLAKIVHLVEGHQLEQIQMNMGMVYLNIVSRLEQLLYVQKV